MCIKGAENVRFYAGLSVSDKRAKDPRTDDKSRPRADDISPPRGRDLSPLAGAFRSVFDNFQPVFYKV